MTWLLWNTSLILYFDNIQDSDDEERKERQKRERIEASIKKREEEVQRTLSTSLRERDKEREQHKKDESIQHFKALLADLVCNIMCQSCTCIYPRRDYLEWFAD